jgi:hypothetical protein
MNTAVMTIGNFFFMTAPPGFPPAVDGFEGMAGTEVSMTPDLPAEVRGSSKGTGSRAGNGSAADRMKDLRRAFLVQ